MSKTAKVAEMLPWDFGKVAVTATPNLTTNAVDISLTNQITSMMSGGSWRWEIDELREEIKKRDREINSLRHYNNSLQMERINDPRPVMNTSQSTLPLRSDNNELIVIVMAAMKAVMAEDKGDLEKKVDEVIKGIMDNKVAPTQVDKVHEVAGKSKSARAIHRAIR